MPQLSFVKRLRNSEATRNAGWLIVEKVIKATLGIVVTLWVARYLGPDAFGTLSFALALVTLFSVLQSLGLDRIVIRDFVRETNKYEEILETALVLRLTGSLLMIIAACAASWILMPGDFQMLCLVAIVSFGWVFKFLDVIDWLFQARVQSLYPAAARTIGLFIGSAAQLALIALGGTVIAFAWVSSLELAVTSLALLVVARTVSRSAVRFRLWRSRAVELLRQSWPVMIASIAVVIQARIDQIIVGQTVGSEELGQYALAMRIVEAFIFIPSAIVVSLTPSIIKARSHSQQQYFDLMVNVYRWMLLTFISIATVLLVTPKTIWLMIVGQKYGPAIDLLPLLSLRLLVTNVGLARSVFITNEGLFRLSMLSFVIGAVISVPLVFWLTARYGAAGAAVASMISLGLSTFLLDPFFSPTRTNLTLIGRALIPTWRSRVS